ncbi:hypothetical protein H8E52_01165 [bacterium]|nr:hypothetical protein [bacterium]
MKRLSLLILMGILVSTAGAIELRNILWDRAFSPNGDEVQDTMPLSFMVTSEDADLTTIRALVSTSSEVPAAPEDWVEVLIEMTGDDIGRFQNLVTEWDGLDDGESSYADGFYYLHIFASTDTEEFWMGPAGEIEINTQSPTFISVAVEPQPFTPLLAGSDTLQQIYFTSADFDTLTDTATLEVFAYSESAGQWYLLSYLERDGEYALNTGEGTRYRFLWSGFGTLGNLQDGVFPGTITLEDDAGNSDQAEVSLDIDTLAPSVSILTIGGWPDDERDFYFNPANLPDSIWVRAEDRYGVDSCRVSWGVDAPFDTLGLAQGSGDPTFEDYLFLIPSNWAADSTYRMNFDVMDMNGHWLSVLDAAHQVAVVLDGLHPQAPQWLTQGGDRIQAYEQITGSAYEAELEIRLYKNDNTVAMDTLNAGGTVQFSFFVNLEEGEQSFRLEAFDASGNSSGLSEALNLNYQPGSAIRIPGRFRGDPGEEIQINTPENADKIELRFFSLEGALLRIVEAQGGPLEWAAEWNMRDSAGRDIAPGLLVVVIRSYLESGEILEDRKVVAIVD